MDKHAEYAHFALELRKYIVDAIATKGGGHIGGSLDIAELLTVLYSGVLRIRPEQPDWPERDYLVCSKGHAGPALYSTLAMKGFFSVEKLKTLNRGGTELPGHCDRNKVPGIDATTGSLGQGLSIAAGLALGAKLRGSGQRVYCILGDGELAEGQNWEAAQFAAHYKLDNLIAFLDWNKMQIDGSDDEVMQLRDPAEKFRAFGWNTAVVKGDNFDEIEKAIDSAKNNNSTPAMIVLKTKKGAGVPCIEALPNNHCIGVPPALAEKAMQELAMIQEKLEKEGTR